MIIIIIINRFVCLDALHPSQQFFNHVGTGLPVSCLRIQHSDFASGESGLHVERSGSVGRAVDFQTHHCYAR